MALTKAHIETIEEKIAYLERKLRLRKDLRVLHQFEQKEIAALRAVMKEVEQYKKLQRLKLKLCAECFDLTCNALEKTK